MKLVKEQCAGCVRRFPMNRADDFENFLMEYYAENNPEILDDDPYYADKIVYSMHPFLPFWRKKH